ncbi:MAG: putative lipid II flippase FtsW [Phycisphaerae bacterium]|nr:putative lipid II flippase FtsW [Phycisphaerae bacterium]
MEQLKQIPHQPNDEGNWVAIIIGALLVLGALMVFSAGAGLDQKIDLRQFWKYATMRRLAFVPITLMVMAIVGRLNYRKILVWKRCFWLSPVVLVMVVSIVLLVLVLKFGIVRNHSRRWLVVGPLQFQPSELGKWVTMMFLAAWCAYRGQKMRNFFTGFLPASILLGAVVGLIGKEDFATAALVGAMGVVVLIMGGVRWWHLLIFMLIGGVACYFLVIMEPYRVERVEAFVDSILNKEGGQEFAEKNYQKDQSIMAVGAGGIWGVGLGMGRIKLGHLPEDTTDFIFAIIAEELGFVGCAMVILLYIMLMYFGMRVVVKSDDPLGRLLAVAISGMIGCQALMNLLVVTGLAPTKGIALPFISAGGTGLVVTGVAAGVLVNVAKGRNEVIAHPVETLHLTPEIASDPNV